MAADNVFKADTACYKINSLVYSHHMYKSIWLAVMGEQHLDKELSNSHDDFPVTLRIIK